MINGQQWLKTRIAALERMLDGDELDEGQREAARAELDQLRDDQRHARGKWWLRALGGRRP